MSIREERVKLALSLMHKAPKDKMGKVKNRKLAAAISGLLAALRGADRDGQEEHAATIINMLENV